MSEKIGVVLVMHGNLGGEFMETCNLITGSTEGMTHVSVGASDDVEEVRGKIRKAIDEVDDGKGTLLLVDMFGGTPSNLSLSFLSEGQVEVITGVNLPMLTKLGSLDPDMDLKKTASVLRDHAREHIKVASEYLSG